ncbi:hypothetical protein LTR85_006460 [Meristemomyces frigidus]|nr:hypothetical protein LTR85_006460 [Meristemomyces frigidus]
MHSVSTWVKSEVADLGDPRPPTRMGFRATDLGARSDVATCGGSVRFIDSRSTATKKLQRSMRKLFTRASPPSAPVPVNAQTASPLFRLPLELRQQIWSLVLTRPADAAHPHFHIYDEIYDSRTHDPNSPALESHARQIAESTALLRTCQTIYSESVQYLYDSTEFELVLIPGRARPHYIAATDTPSRAEVAWNIRQRNSLGKLANCSVQLQRIRRATIVVQPGHSPDVRAYCRQIHDFLAAIACGSKLKYLCLKLNLQKKMNLVRQDAFGKNVHALAPLGEQQAVRTGARLQRETVHMPRQVNRADGGDTAAYSTGIATLQAMLHILDGKVVSWKTSLDQQYRHDCAFRGMFGRGYYPTHPPPQTRGQEMAEMAGKVTAIALFVTVALPVTAPTAVLAYVQRKRDKGERWWGEGERGLYRKRR